jgi:hypothetical protein
MAKARSKSTGADALSALTAAAGKKPTTAAAKKSKIPSATLDANDAEEIKNWLDGHRMKKAGESLMSDAEGVLIDKAWDELAERSFKTGTVVKSVRLEGECDYVLEDAEGNPVLENGKPVQKHFRGGVRCTQAAKWLKMGAVEKEQLEAEFTDPDEFAKLFAVDQKFEIDVDAINSRPGLADRLLKALGEDADILQLALTVKPTEAFLTRAMTEAPMTKRWDKLKADGLCKLQKISFGK